MPSAALPLWSSDLIAPPSAESEKMKPLPIGQYRDALALSRAYFPAERVAPETLTAGQQGGLLHP